jgi:GT2 family glycosyltransferase
VGGFREGFEGSQDYDLVLRLVNQTKPQRIRHIPFILYHWRLGEGVATFSTDFNDEAVAAARRALGEHFSTRGENVRVIAGRVPYWHRIERLLPNPIPRVSLVVTAGSHLPPLRNCIDGLLHGTDYPNCQIIVVGKGSHDPHTLDYLNSLRTKDHVRVLNIDEQSNFGAINNRAALEADGEIIGFISNNLEVIDPGWLREMVAQVVQPGVAAVGAKLYYRDDTIQHAGLVLGMTGVVGQGHRKYSRSAIGYYGQLQLVRNLSCVTAACMLVLRSAFEEVKGFDETRLKAAYHDLDLCLALREAAYNIVWTPYSELYYTESESDIADFGSQNADVIREDSAYIERKWANQLKHDPFYSPNLSLKSEDFAIAFPPRVSKPWRDRPVALLQGLKPETPRRQIETEELSAYVSVSLRLVRQQALVIQRLQRELQSTRLHGSRSMDTNGAKGAGRLISGAVNRAVRALKNARGSAQSHP